MCGGAQFLAYTSGWMATALAATGNPEGAQCPGPGRGAGFVGGTRRIPLEAGRRHTPGTRTPSGGWKGNYVISFPLQYSLFQVKKGKPKIRWDLSVEDT